MKSRALLATLTVAGAAALAAVPAVSDAAVSAQSAVSENWSGYAVSDTSGNVFTSVSGSWVEPTVNCSSGSGYDAFWVGLGGASQQNNALEQIGTQVACTGSSTGQHFAWYELVPAGPVNLDVAIHSGDRISASVTVNGTNVTVWLKNDTTGQAITKALQMSNPDTSTAEWIAEAPSQCDGSGNCQTLPLANFGSVKFSGATATADGHTGPISDWDAQPVELQPGSQFVATGGAGSQAGAQPTTLVNDGSSFAVQWLASADSSGGVTSSGYGGYPGQGSGDPGAYPGGYGGGYGGDGGGYGAYLYGYGY